jgi:UPF0716 protein FxsA
MRLGVLWLLVLIAVEIWSISAMSHYVGFWATLILLVGDAYFGLQLMRSQGLKAMMSAQQGAQASPLNGLAAGLIRALAGLLFVIPGFVSDLLALLLLLPFVHNPIIRQLARKTQFQGFAAGGFGGFGGAFGQGGFGASAQAPKDVGNVYDHQGSAASGNNIIEGQFIEHKADK